MIDNTLHLAYTLPTMSLITNTLSDYKVSLRVFEGPLDLLLRLIEREELDITEVSLAVVTDQYLAHLAELHSRSAANLADFLAVAARLLLIKSRVLLPSPPQDSEGEQEADEEEWEYDLVTRLREYKRFKEVAAGLRDREESGMRSYARMATPPEVPSLHKPDVHDPEMLRQVYRQVLETNPQAKPVDDVVSPLNIHMRDCLSNILHHVRRNDQTRFSTLMAEARSWLEVIVTFVAMLELIKQRQITVAQEKLFGEIYLRARRSSEANPSGD